MSTSSRASSSLAQSLALLAALFTAPLLAQTTPPVPVAFPNTTQVPGKLLYRSPTLVNRITNIAYHNGVFYTNMVTGADRRVWRFTDPANAASLTQDPTRNDSNIPLINDHGNHAHTKVGDYLGGFYEISIMRQSPGVNVVSRFAAKDALHPNIEAHGLYWPWYLPFHWVQYAGLNGPTPSLIYRPNAAGTGPQKLAEWNSLAEDGVTGNSILIGNLLFITSDESSLGILCYDISPIFRSPAERPVLLDKLTGNFGAYIAAPFENYIILSRNEPKKVEVIDYSDPTDLRLVASIDVTGNSALTGDTSVSYIQAQDNFVFAQRHKVDMTNFTPVLQLDQVGNNRPAGSVSGVVDTSQYMMPLGNLLVTAGYSFGDPDRLAVWAHQAEPDTRKPYVGYHIPRPGQTNYPLGAPISLLIHETLESFTIINGQTVILREVGTTTPIDCWTSFSHDDVLTITPKSYLALNKTYEVVIVANGIKDAAGNGIEPYSFTFSTGSSVSGGNAAPALASFVAGPSPAPVGSTVTFTAAATDPESDALEYRFAFGDSTPATAWSATASATHTYATKGHYVAKVQVRDLKPDGSRSTVSKDLTVTIANPITATLPRNSSSVAIDTAARRVWAVNPDADTVTVLDADTRAKLAEHDLVALLGLATSASVDPRSVALDASGRAWIACHDADRVVVLSPAGALVQSIATGYGSAPIGIALTPDNASAFVTLTGSGLLKRYSASTFAETGSLALGPTPRALAITGDSSRLLVTRFLSELNQAQVWDVANGPSLTLTRSWNLLRDRTPDNASAGRGVPNQLAGVTLSPDSRWAWVTASKMNDEHGLLFAGGRQSTDNTVRALVLRLDLTRTSEREDSLDRLDVDNSDSPTGVVFSPLGDWAFISLQGNNQIAVYDDFGLQSGASKGTRWRFNTDLAPQGLAIDPVTRTLFVNNFMSRTITAHDLTAFFSQGTRNAPAITRPLVANEKLPPVVLAGKQIFYNASLKDILGFDAISRDTYVSCATCHSDGSLDGRTWDFTQRGEGLRNTTDLRGRSGMGHGNVHWTANFDEIQDFENDIRDHFGGTGLIDGVDVSGPLGTPKTGLSPQLDALAAYVSSLGRSTYPKSPHRNPDGTETAAAIAGREVFRAQNCMSCHGGANFTDSTGGLGIPPRLHDVGTLRTTSGGRLGAALPGIDTPTLLGLHATAPYLHDGSATTLAEVFRVTGGITHQAESGVVGGSASKPGFISQNYANTVRGSGLVEFNGGGTLTLTNIDGGPGGVGSIELRVSHGGTRNLTVRVNSTDYAVTSVGQNPGWQLSHWLTLRRDGIAFTAGATNTLRITAADLSLDDVTVSTAAHLAKAEPHRRVLALGTTDENNLLAYLRQLDGSSPPAIQPLAEFRAAHGLAADGSQDTAAPAGDGVANLLKYAFNMIGSGVGQAPGLATPNATTITPSGSAGLPLIELENGRLQVTYVRRKASGNPGVVYTVQFSDSLAPGSWSVNPAATSAITSLDATLERVTVRDSASPSPRRFARVLVAPGAAFPPVIVSSAAAAVPLNSPFSFAVTASDSPTSYAATGLPAGLAINRATGVISGTPTTPGTYPVTVSVENAAGITTQTLTLTVSPLQPNITSATTASGTLAAAFSYQITSPIVVTSYSATGLPAGLTINPSTGLISGTPSAVGVFTVTLGATNSAGTTNATLTLTIDAPFGPNRAVGGNASASGENTPDEGSAQAFDGNVGTKWLAFSPTGWLAYTFGGTQRYTLAAYALVSGNDAPDRDPRNWQLQGSDDGVVWTTLDTRSGETFATRGLAKDYVVSGTTAAYRRYRLNVTLNNNNGGGILQLAELRLYGAPQP